MTPAGQPHQPFTIVLRGYDRDEVDRYLNDHEPGERPPQFSIGFRGYERTQVDTYIERSVQRRGSDTVRGSSLETPRFTVVLRGYEVTEVDRFVAKAQAHIAELEAAIERLQSDGL